jgi:AraC-like DNA-binding protein
MKEPGRTAADPRALESVLRAAERVEERLGDPIGVEDLARAACYSPFYFSRLFVQATGHSPYDYLMRRRVAAAAEEVVGGDRSLTGIALDYGFEAPDSFSRAFRRCFGLLPSEARKAGSYPRRIARTRITREYAADLLEFPPTAPERVDAGPLFLAGGTVESAPGLAGYEVVTRGDGLEAAAVFRGVRIALAGSAAPEIPAFPGTATLVPAGVFARFRLARGAAGLRTAAEYAYRVWIPGAGDPFAPAYDLVEYGPSGPEALLVPALSL